MTFASRSLTISDWSLSGDQTSQALFNTNVIQSSNTGAPWFSGDPTNPLGNPTAATDAAIDYFGITMIRFPGGETNAVFSKGMMVDGALPDSIVTFLTYASDAKIAVNMVVPVEKPAILTRTEFLDQMQDFATALHQQFPGVVHSFELGNEYWGGRVAFDASLETEYGVNAGQVAVALSAGSRAAGQDADVFLQASGNLRGAFRNDPDQANDAIRAGVDQVSGARAALDGIIRNSYWKDADLDGFENSSGVFAEDRGLGQNLEGGDTPWEAWAGRALLTRVGEYNINKNIALGNTDVDIGVHGASYLLEHMANMIEAGVDQAFVWPISHNTQNAILFRDETITTQTVHGMDIATNTTRAAMLDLMRQTVASHELVRAGWTLSGDDAAPGSDVELTLFQAAAGAPEAAADQIVFLSSRSAQDMQLEVDLSDFVTGFDSLTITSIHHAAKGGNLRDAVVSEVTPDQIGDGAIFAITLRPYEVVQFAFESAPAPIEEAPPWDDFWALPMAFDTDGPLLLESSVATPTDPVKLRGQDSGETLFGGVQDDAIFARGGDDVLMAASGADVLRGGAGHDLAYGGMGNDTIHGDLGRDTLSGDGGADLLTGGYGDDLLVGGAGNDTLIGGMGADRFVHDHLDRGFDLIRDFDMAQDRLVLDDPALTGPESIRLLAYLHENTPSTLIRFLDGGGKVDTTRGGLVLHGIARPEFDINAVEFAPQDPDGAPGADTILPGYEGLDDLHPLLLPYTGEPDIAADADAVDDPIWTIAA